MSFLVLLCFVVVVVVVIFFCGNNLKTEYYYSLQVLQLKLIFDVIFTKDRRCHRELPTTPRELRTSTEITYGFAVQYSREGLFFNAY